MLSAVWAAAVVAAASWVIGVCVAVYVMLKAARLMTESSAALASLRERENLLIERAGAVIDRAGEQIAQTETITANMGDVTASMGDMAASMAELRGRHTALAPPARAGDGGTVPPGTVRAAPPRRATAHLPAPAPGALTWAGALVYGVTRALGLRWAKQYPLIQRRAALTGRRGGAPQ